jgi:hypothetical protein
LHYGAGKIKSTEIYCENWYVKQYASLTTKLNSVQIMFEERLPFYGLFACAEKACQKDMNFNIITNNTVIPSLDLVHN